MDVHCHKCGEPWDSYGLFHGDVYAWQADAIINGAGCPSCEGQSVEHELTFAEMDEHEVALEGNDPFDETKVLEYKRPPKVVLWKCTKCKHEETQWPDDLQYDGRGNIKYIGRLNEEPLIVDDDGKEVKVCQDCYDNCIPCYECDKRFFDPEDTIYIQDEYKTVCLSCFEEFYSNCEKCGESTHQDNLNGFQDHDYCNFCLGEIKRDCESCGDEFHIDDAVEEFYCSKECFEESVEDESELLLEER